MWGAVEGDGTQGVLAAYARRPLLNEAPRSPCHHEESLPGAAMAGWTTLTLLDVSHNQLRCLPGEVGACASLETLLAGNNRLAVIPAQVSALQLLKTLNLDCNRWMLAGGTAMSV